MYLVLYRTKLVIIRNITKTLTTNERTVNHCYSLHVDFNEINNVFVIIYVIMITMPTDEEWIRPLARAGWIQPFRRSLTVPTCQVAANCASSR